MAVPFLASLIALVAVGCGSGDGLPSKDGTYPVQSRSVTWDGDQYRFAWADPAGTLHQAHGRDIKLVQDNQSFLQVTDHHGILHLQPSEPITVLGQDRNGGFTDAWFPFLAGAALGNVLGGLHSPGYYYPPTDRFGRGDELHGSVSRNEPSPPDYASVKPPPDAVRPAAGSVSGQSSGTGGGSAATNKVGGASADSSSAVSGQSGGTGSGSAVTDKGGFRAGNSSYPSRSSSSSGSDSSGSGSSLGGKGLGGSLSGGKGISGAGGGHSSGPSRSTGAGSRGHR